MHHSLGTQKRSIRYLVLTSEISLFITSMRTFLTAGTKNTALSARSTFSFVALVVFRGSRWRFTELGKKSMFHLNCQRFYLRCIHPLQDGLPKSEYLHLLNLHPPRPQ